MMTSKAITSKITLFVLICCIFLSCLQFTVHQTVSVREACAGADGAKPSDWKNYQRRKLLENRGRIPSVQCTLF